jgi:hypothetical protein
LFLVSKLKSSNLIRAANQLLLCPDQTVECAALRGFCIPYVSYMKMLYNNTDDEFLLQNVETFRTKIEALFTDSKNVEGTSPVCLSGKVCLPHQAELTKSVTPTLPEKDTVFEKSLSRSKRVDERNKAYSEIKDILDQAASSVDLKGLSSSTRDLCFSSIQDLGAPNDEQSVEQARVSHRLRQEIESISDRTKEEGFALSQRIIQEMSEI